MEAEFLDFVDRVVLTQSCFYNVGGEAMWHCEEGFDGMSMD